MVPEPGQRSLSKVKFHVLFPKKRALRTSPLTEAEVLSESDRETLRMRMGHVESRHRVFMW